MHDSKTFSIEATIETRGRIANLSYLNGWEGRRASALLMALSRLPFVEPALVDGKPLPSDILFNLKIDKSLYSYSWQLQPIGR